MGKKVGSWNSAIEAGRSSDGLDMEIKLSKVIKRELRARGQSINFVAEATRIPVSTLHNWSQGALPNGKNLHLEIGRAHV